MLCKWDVVIDDTVDSSSIVENIAGSGSVVVDTVWCEGCTVWWDVLCGVRDELCGDRCGVV